REEARKALAEHGGQEKEQTSPAAAKSGPKESEQRDPQNQGQPGQCKNCSGPNPGAGGGKSAGGSPTGKTPQGNARGDGARQTAQGGNPSQEKSGQGESGDKRAEGAPAGSAKGRGDQIRPDGAPGSGEGGGHVSNNEPAPGGGEQLPDRPADAKQPRRPGELVLEDLRKTLEELNKHPQELKKVLDQAGLKRKELRDVEQDIDATRRITQQDG